jgi:flavin reductase (DIM6/NTAB) family NADH-FMN oxidoreductase RutF
MKSLETLQSPFSSTPMQALAALSPVAHTHQDSADYRKALGCYATGVTVITTHWQDSDWGMTCSSFASVSLQPRLVLWTIRKAASSREAYYRSGGFAISVLSESQDRLAAKFATGDMASRFAGVPMERLPDKRQRLSEAVAWFDCSLHALIDAGDHQIVVGQVLDFGWNDGEVLGYCRSKYSRVQAKVA